jgi:hypothetical protein
MVEPASKSLRVRMHLAHGLGLIAFSTKGFSQKYCALRKRIAGIGMDAMRVSVLPGQQRPSRSDTYRAFRKRSRESHACISKLVEVWRLNVAIAIGADAIPAMLIRGDEQYVGLGHINSQLPRCSANSLERDDNADLLPGLLIRHAEFLSVLLSGVLMVFSSSPGFEHYPNSSLRRRR